MANETVAQSGQVIAFNVLENEKTDDYEVYIVKSDGSTIRNVTNHPDVAWTYHSIPGKLLFISDRGACKRCYFLYSSGHDGQNVERVSNLQLEDSWMGSRRDGKELIVSGRIDTRIRHQLFLIDVASGSFRQITNEPGAMYRDPIFSPDGKWIVFAYKKDRTDRLGIEELYIMKPNGSERRRLTTYPADDPFAKEYGYKAGPPQWNAKYDFISYISNQSGKQSIYAVTPDGRKQWKLIDTDRGQGWHDWSKDGEWLVFDSKGPDGRYDIFLMNYTERTLKNLTANSESKFNQGPIFLR